MAILKNIFPLITSFVIAIFTLLLIPTTHLSSPRIKLFNNSNNQTKESNSTDIEKLGLREDSIIYKDYKIYKVFDVIDTNYNIYYVEIFKNEKNVYHSEIGVEKSEYLSIELKDLLNKNSKQLILDFYSGGAHCCNTCFIYDLLKDSLHEIYNGNNYIGEVNGLITEDINTDNKFEIIQYYSCFDYFDRLCHAESPSAPVVFNYSEKRKKYVVANKLFETYLLKETKEFEKRVSPDLANFEVKNYEDSCSVLASTLSILLDYIFAGKENQGWEYFNKYYKVADKDIMVKNIKKILSESKVYNEMYH